MSSRPHRPVIRRAPARVRAAAVLVGALLLAPACGSPSGADDDSDRSDESRPSASGGAGPTESGVFVLLDRDDFQEVLDRTRERFPDLWTPGRSDLCFATTNRQSALMQIAPRCDAMVVIGSSNSSNTRALERLAREAGCEQVFRVNGADELPAELEGTVGVTAGASAPEDLVEAVLRRLDPSDGVEEVRITDEDEYFPPPRNLRDLIASLGDAATLALGGPLEDLPPTDDRSHPASDVLAALT